MASEYGYKRIVLGAWGCGAFSNDAKTIAKLFHEVIRNLKAGTFFFPELYFAVLDRSQDQYNFKAFTRYFDGNNFYKDEEEAK